MEQYKEYPIIQVYNGFIVIDKEAKRVNNSYYFFDVGYGFGIRIIDEKDENLDGFFKIIAHSGIKSLKDSGLPLFEIPKKDTTIFDALDRAYKYLHALGFFTTPTNEGRIVENLLIQAGVRANEAAGGYTEEDINNAIIKGYELARDSFYYTDGSIQPEIMKYIQSLKKYPTSALVEGVLASQWVSNENGYGRVENFFLKVDKNNHIIIKDFYYS